MATNPFSVRTFVLLDKTNSVRRDRIVKMGVPIENIFVLSKNGIEHYYPVELVATFFRCAPAEVASIDLEKDPIEFNGIRLTKKELAEVVASKVTPQATLDEELTSFIQRVRLACG